MAQRSDTKQRMVQAARQLIRERGYHATAISDVLERSGAPRGSVYFHFPGGKPQLAMEAAEEHAHEQVAYIDRAADQADSAAGLVEVYLDLAREGMVTSDYTRGGVEGRAAPPAVALGAGPRGQVGPRSWTDRSWYV